MKIKGKNICFDKLFCIVVYYILLSHLPSSTFIIRPVGKLCKKLRFLCCRHIFKSCGKNVNIERKAYFGSGLNICIGDNSGIGQNANIPSDTIIGANVMMGPNCYILQRNHKFESIDIPMVHQGYSESKQTVIEDNVWIGRDVLMTPGRKIQRGTIIAAACLLCKDFPAYSIVGGNPARLLKTRL